MDRKRDTGERLLALIDLLLIASLIGLMVFSDYLNNVPLIWAILGGAGWGLFISILKDKIRKKYNIPETSSSGRDDRIDDDDDDLAERYVLGLPPFDRR